MSGNDESIENGQDTRITSKKEREDTMDARQAVVPSFDASLSSSRPYLV
jgi:hypothetical protein